MNTMDDGCDPDATPASPLFASSWMALYFLLKQELEALREAGADEASNDDTESPEESIN